MSLAILVAAFTPSLLPIALAYHLAHNQAFLLLGTQYLIPLLSDPFGFGWDVFGTALHQVNFSLIQTSMIWYVGVVAIVGGHIVAILCAHAAALRLFVTRAAALRAELPMVALMIFFTMSSLWLLAQPITNTRSGG